MKNIPLLFSQLPILLFSSLILDMSCCNVPLSYVLICYYTTMSSSLSLSLFLSLSLLIVILVIHQFGLNV